MQQNAPILKSSNDTAMRGVGEDENWRCSSIVAPVFCLVREPLMEWVLENQQCGQAHPTQSSGQVCRRQQPKVLTQHFELGHKNVA